jgi:hypothetical protein
MKRFSLPGWAVAAALLALALAVPATAVRAQGSRVSPPWPPPAGSFMPEANRATTVYAFTCRNRTCADALPLLRPLLSEIGTVELQPGGNTLVVRDQPESIDRVVAALRQYDQPPQRVRIELLIVHADSASPAKPSETAAPKWIAERLRNLLRWEYYSLLAQTAVDVREGEDVTYEFSDGYRVTFKLGSISPDEKLRFNDFRVERRGAKVDQPAQRLLSANLNVLLARPTTLGLTKSEQSQNALFLVMTATRVVDPIVVPPPVVKPKGKGRH